MGFRLQVAATKNDWLSVFQQIRDSNKLKFYPCGVHMSTEVSACSLEAIPDLGVALKGFSISEPAYLASAEEKMVFRKFQLLEGGMRYSLDQSLNPQSFILIPAGIFQGAYFVAGEISSIYKDGLAVTIARHAISYIRRHWFSDEFCIGPECYSLYKDSREFGIDFRNRNTDKPWWP